MKEVKPKMVECHPESFGLTEVNIYTAFSPVAHFSLGITTDGYLPQFQFNSSHFGRMSSLNSMPSSGTSFIHRWDSDNCPLSEGFPASLVTKKETIKLELFQATNFWSCFWCCILSSPKLMVESSRLYSTQKTLHKKNSHHPVENLLFSDRH